MDRLGPVQSNHEFHDDGKNSDFSYDQRHDHFSDFGGHQNVNTFPFEFRTPVQSNTTHFVGAKTPLEGFLNNHEGPYNPGFAYNTDGLVRSSAPNYADFAHLGAFGKSISEGGHPPSDSGYQTRSAGAISRSSGDFPMYMTTNGPPDLTSPLQTPSKPKSNRGKNESIKCPNPNCNKVSSCRSDYTKHERMHTKPFICKEPECKRGREGFTTQNDLGRHIKSCHLNGMDGKSKSWRCAGKNCKDPAKVWPRFDNFKQHVTKMHSSEDAKDVLKRSEIMPGVTREADSDSAQVVIPANLSNAALPDSQPVILVTDEGNSAFKPINTEQVTLTGISASPAVPSNIKSGALPSPVSTVPSASNDSKTPPSATDEQSSNTKKGKMPSADASRAATVESNDSREEMNLLISLLQTITSVIETLNKEPGSARKLDYYAKIRSSVMRLPEECATTEDPSVRDQEAEGIEGGQQQCTVCNKFIKRSCDMRKHMKRHTRPYGCTWSNCYSCFGSKNDWKRHESTQHGVSDIWKCCEQSNIPGQPGGICGQAFHRQKDFENHLVGEHKHGDEFASISAENSHISRSSHSRFWCGFCIKLHKVEGRGALISNERYTHVADHFIKENKSIGDWVDVSQHKKKREMQSNSKDSKDQTPESEFPDSVHDSNPSQGPIAELQVQQPSQRHDSAQERRASGSKKRTRLDEAEDSHIEKQKRPRKNASMWECCNCGDFNNVETSESCLASCGHQKCPGCSLEPKE